MTWVKILHNRCNWPRCERLWGAEVDEGLSWTSNTRHSPSKDALRLMEASGWWKHPEDKDTHYCDVHAPQARARFEAERPVPLEPYVIAVSDQRVTA
jgi:hypothetical protein